MNLKRNTKSWGALTVCGLSLCLLYQGINFFYGFFKWEQEKSAMRVELKAFGREVAALSTSKMKLFEVTRAVDGASDLMQQLGYVLNYWAGRRPEFFFVGAQKPLYRAFLREEIPYQFPSSLSKLEKGIFRQMRSLAEHLTKGKVTFLVVPVPTKISIDRHHIAGLPLDSVWGSYFAPKNGEEEAPDRVYQRLVEILPNHVVDVYGAFTQFRSHSNREELFVPGDTHWSSLGIAQTVAAVVKHLRHQAWKLEPPRVRKVSEGWTFLYHDLIKPLQLPLWYLKREASFAWREPIYSVNPVVNSHQGNVYLAGTCYSQRFKKEKLSFGHVLAQTLSRTLLDASVKNTDALGPLRRMANEKWVLSPGDLLVWEFPIRSAATEGHTIPRVYLKHAKEHSS